MGTQGMCWDFVYQLAGGLLLSNPHFLTCLFTSSSFQQRLEK